MLSLCVDGGGIGKELTDEALEVEGATDATGVSCGLRISRCGFRVEVCEFFFSSDFVGYERAGVIFSTRRL